MKVGIWSDAHITKKHRENTEKFQDLVLKAFETMYKAFQGARVEYVVNCGDFLDKPMIESSDAQFLNKVMNIIQESKLDTYFLLGNHEAYKDSISVLNLLEREHVKIISHVSELPGGILMFPYWVNPEDLDMSGKIICSHHDIFGKSLSNLTGLSHEIFKDAKLVLNGHIHQREKVADNIWNVGSLFSQAFNDNESPGFSILDTETMKLEYCANENTFHYVKVETLEDMTKVDDKGKTFINCVGFEAPEDDRFLKISSTPIVDINIQDTGEITTENKSVKELLTEFCSKNKLSDEVLKKSLEVYDASNK